MKWTVTCRCWQIRRCELECGLPPPLPDSNHPYSKINALLRKQVMCSSMVQCGPPDNQHRSEQIWRHVFAFGCGRYRSQKLLCTAKAHCWWFTIILIDTRLCTNIVVSTLLRPDLECVEPLPIISGESPSVSVRWPQREWVGCGLPFLSHIYDIRNVATRDITTSAFTLPVQLKMQAAQG